MTREEMKQLLEDTAVILTGTIRFIEIVTGNDLDAMVEAPPKEDILNTLSSHLQTLKERWFELDGG